MPRLFIGLMSGTSLDGVDGVLAESFGDATPPLRVLGHVHLGFEPALRAELLALNDVGPDELRRAALAGNALARTYAGVVERLLALGGTSSNEVTAIGAHGQTVRHAPGAGDGTGYTLQIGNAALLAELVCIDVIADLRSRDVAAGGQGAPLAPGFHRAMFARDGESIAVLNVGGISNLTLLDPTKTVGFDCGPGNALMDHWVERHSGQAYDDGGRLAASGRVLDGLLGGLLAEPYLALPPPKSTGRELFNPGWLAPRLAQHAARASPADVQATLAEFTVECIARELQRRAAGCRRLLVCGGGALNGHLMRRLASRVPGVQVQATDSYGLPPLQVEAAAFAWLAARFIDRRPGNLPSVTGAAGERILGALYPAGRPS